MAEPYEIAVLIIATLTVGAMTGVMGLYANTLMPGLRRSGDQTFVSAFQAIDTRIINPWFLSAFLGGLVLIGVSALFFLDEATVLPWLLVALGCYLLVVVITITVNVPLNDRIKAAGPVADPEEVARVRSDFSEERWVRWNWIRLLLTALSSLSLAWALVLVGRLPG